ncbi:MAG: M81 family metallopeptidase [Kiritimatiellia bacterium]
MKPSPNILIAGIFHETHSFLQQATVLDDFSLHEGDALISRYQGSQSPMDGVLSVGKENNWHIIPSIMMTAMPSGPVDEEVITRFLSSYLRDLTRVASSLDGIYLVLHGAMISTDRLDVEGDILERTRNTLPANKKQIPIGGILDLHATFSQKMAKQSTCMLAYRENPHSDAKEAAERAAHLLNKVISENLTPNTRMMHSRLLLNPVGTGSADLPMSALLQKAREIEQSDPDILGINVFAGFSYADTPGSGCVVNCIHTGTKNEADAHLNVLVEIARKYKEYGVPVEPSIEEVFQQLPCTGSGPVLLVEPADNIGGGCPGDATDVLDAALRHRLPNLVAIINDPDAVSLCRAAGLNQTLRTEIGAKTDRFHGEPLSLEGTVIHLSDGDFELENPHSHLASIAGTHIRMGPCAVFVSETATILLTSKKTPPMDLGQLRSQGIQPEEAGYIIIKAAVAHRSAYDPIARASFHVASRGLCAGNLSTLPYQHVNRPIYPLDEIE